MVAITFILGWGFGEKNVGNIDSLLDFTTQSVQNEGAKVTVTNKGSLKVFQVAMDDSNEAIGTNTQFVECPGSKLPALNIEIGYELPPKMYDPATNSEINFFGYSLNFLATSATKKAKFLTSSKKPLAAGQCIYGIMDSMNKLDSLLVYDIKLVDNCVPSKGGFECN